MCKKINYNYVNIKDGKYNIINNMYMNFYMYFKIDCWKL